MTSTSKVGMSDGFPYPSYPGLSGVFPTIFVFLFYIQQFTKLKALSSKSVNFLSKIIP